MKKIICFFFIVTAILGSCKKDDPALPDNLVNFQASSQGIASDSVTTTVKLVLSRAANAAIPITVGLQATGMTYGTEFTTDPAASGNTLTVTIPAGSTSASFVVKKASGVFLSGAESLTLAISQVSAPALKGTTDTLKLSFGAIVSEGAQLQLEGKTDASNYTNSVFVDLSNNSQSAVPRKSWNLGFSGGSDFRVILNPGYQTTAAALATSDLNAVTLDDTASVLDLNHNISDPATAALVDSWDGDLSKTVFAEVSATDADNKVYLLSFEGNKTPRSSWYKVRVVRKGDGYSVQYAKVGEATVKTLDVPKEADYNFSFASLESGQVVDFEPQKASWDLEWSYSTYNSGLGSPYWFQDFILLNYEGGAGAAEIMTATVSYDDFSETNLSGLSFLRTRDAIGSSWRSTTGTGIYRDRFYAIKDPQGNIYKLRFVSMGVGSDGGERGRPVIEYKLVKKA